jgi:hypothetical protein
MTVLLVWDKDSYKGSFLVILQPLPQLYQYSFTKIIDLRN